MLYNAWICFLSMGVAIENGKKQHLNKEASLMLEMMVPKKLRKMNWECMAYVKLLMLPLEQGQRERGGDFRRRFYSFVSTKLVSFMSVSPLYGEISKFSSM